MADPKQPDYAAMYRRAHPRLMPFSPWERQRELSDLWPSKQAKFRKLADAMLAEKDRRDDR